jgi:hypothetical protein
MLSIQVASNGYIVRETDDYDDDKLIGGPMVVAEQDTADSQGKVEAGCELLWEVIERLGLAGSKHDSHRLRVSVESNVE